MTEHNPSKMVWKSLSPGGRHRCQAYLGYYRAIVDRDYKGSFYFGIYLHGVCEAWREKIKTHRKAQEEAEKAVRWLREIHA